jgi:hypothetical protein
MLSSMEKSDEIIDLFFLAGMLIGASSSELE